MYSLCRFQNKERITANERCFRVAEGGPNEARIHFDGSIQKDTVALPENFSAALSLLN
jgi:hypothetical protein